MLSHNKKTLLVYKVLNKKGEKEGRWIRVKVRSIRSRCGRILPFLHFEFFREQELNN